MSGWIKLHRKLLEWQWYKDANTFRLFSHLLLTCNYEKKLWMQETIEAGSRVAGRLTLSQETGLTVQQVRRSLELLKSTNEITIKTTNKYSIISIVKWGDYQLEEPAEQPTNNQQTTNKQPQLKKERNKEIKNINISLAVSYYNEFAERYGLPVCQKITGSREGKLSARLNDCGGLEGWKVALQKLEESDFLLGKVKEFKADIDFLLQEKSFVRLMEGFYKNKTVAQPVSKQDAREIEMMEATANAIRRMEQAEREKDFLNV